MLSRLQSLSGEFSSDPFGLILFICYYVTAILASLILHECAHGWVAYRCGDPTAKMMGRLSLNPARHLDPMGTLFMFLVGIGWAKPVPVNPRNFKHFRRDDFLVSIAGITVNLTLFLICVIGSVLLNRAILGQSFIQIENTVYTNGALSYASPFYLNGYNIINGNWASLAADVQQTVNIAQYGFSAAAIPAPIYTNAEGWEVLGQFFSAPWLLYVQRFLLLMAQVNLSLALFNLLPIPPLDGYHLINDTLLGGKLNLNYRVFRVAQIVMIFIFLSGILDPILSKGITTIYDVVLSAMMKLTGQL